MSQKREPTQTRVLIVDDEDLLRKAMSSDFKRKGYQVFEASNGRDAFEIVKNNTIDIVLSDVRMPGGDGIELLNRIKEVNPDTPIVMFVTGFADMTLEEAYHKGADAVFMKPFDRKELFEAVNKQVLPKGERWQQRDVRINTEFEIQFQFEGLKTAIAAKVMNIGRGGMFVAFQGQFPSVGKDAAFSIEFKQSGPPHKIQGHGIVRWVRYDSVQGRPSGCGIEFQHIDDKDRDELVTFIESLRTKSFIPRE